MLRIGRTSEKEARNYSFVGSLIQYLRAICFHIKGNVHLCLQAAHRSSEEMYI